MRRSERLSDDFMSTPTAGVAEFGMRFERTQQGRSSAEVFRRTHHGYVVVENITPVDGTFSSSDFEALHAAFVDIVHRHVLITTGIQLVLPVE